MILDHIRPLTPAEAMIAEVPPPDRVLGPLQPGDIALLSGADGSGKSLVALAMAAAVAYGLPACGVVDAPDVTGRVLYVAGEDRRADHIRRLRRLIQRLQWDHRLSIDGEQKLALWPLEGARMPLVAPQGDGYAITPIGDAFARAVIDGGYRLVILDPLRMYHDCVESDGPGMDYLARWLVTISMRAGCAMLLVHHASQGAILDGRTDHHAGRGATDLPAACRAVWTLRGMTQREAEQWHISDDERRNWRVLYQGKATHDQEDGARWLRRMDGLWVRSTYTPDEEAEIARGGRGNGRTVKTAVSSKAAAIAAAWGAEVCDDPDKL